MGKHIVKRAIRARVQNKHISRIRGPFAADLDDKLISLGIR